MLLYWKRVKQFKGNYIKDSSYTNFTYIKWKFYKRLNQFKFINTRSL